MNYTHYVWSIKLSAWWGRGSAYTSDMKQAKPYTHAEAIEFCRKHVALDGGLAAVPVRIEDIEELLKK